MIGEHIPGFYNVKADHLSHNQDLKLETQEGSVQSHSTLVRSNAQLLHNQNKSTPTRLESMEAVSSISTSNTFAFCAGEKQLIEFDEGFYNTDIPGMEISNLVSDESKSSSSSSSSSICSSCGKIPRSDTLWIKELEQTEEGRYTTMGLSFGALMI
ncbi:hypothetical protein ACTFIV_005196 [Dictyostelium citrinum]